MELSLSQKYNRKIANAIAEFNLINDGDNILIAFSGGIDSAFLLYALKIFEKNMSINFDLTAISIDIGFSKVNYSSAQKFCHDLEIPLYIKNTKIADIISKKDNNPCASCTYFRKGAITEFIRENNFRYNKIAYGHHYNDAVETFLLNIIYSGQIKTFMPKNNLTQAKAEQIRPLIYLREREINEFMSPVDYKVVDNKCPYEKNNKRKKIKEILNDFKNQKQILYNIASAMREDSIVELWPEEKNREKIQEIVYELWNGD